VKQPSFGALLVLFVSVVLILLFLVACQGSNKAGAMAGAMPACLFICVTSQQITETATTGDLTGRTTVSGAEPVYPPPPPTDGGSG